MSLGLLAKKVGMTHVYNEDGTSTPVTVLDVSGNTVLQVKSTETDGYHAVQVGFDNQKESRINQPRAGHFKRWSSSPKRLVREFRLDAAADVEPGATLAPTLFEVGQSVDVIGETKGRGFQGAVKRWGFAGSPQSHGSMMHRRTGAIGCRLTPGRVWKNQRMPGHMGTVRRTVQNLKIVQVREDDGLILVSGGVPGAKGGYLVLRPAKKASSSASAA